MGQHMFCLAIFLEIASIVGVEIRHMRVPPVIQSGSAPYVILDCDYDLSETEGTQVDVKWFFRDDPQPFFQWLPGRPPQAIGELFQNRIDLTYEVDGGDRWRKHRALKILKPTTELSGSYRCKVSSFVDEDFMQKTMIVYSPPSDIRLIYFRPNPDQINLTCSVYGVYPKPEVRLSWGKRFDERGETTTLTVERDGIFDVSVNKVLSEARLKPETIFKCHLTIPGTDFNVKEETLYFPGKVLPQTTMSSASVTSSSLGLAIFSSAILALLLRRHCDLR